LAERLAALASLENFDGRKRGESSVPVPFEGNGSYKLDESLDCHWVPDQS
jgi:hypothetical protein